MRTASRTARADPRPPETPGAGGFARKGPRTSRPRATNRSLPLTFLGCVAALVSGWAVTGCDFFTIDGDPAAEARVVLDGEESTPLEMVTSNRWEPGGTADDGSQQVVLLTSDTAEVEVPFDGSFGLEDENRFFVRVKNLDPESGPTVTMQVFLDDEEFYNRTRTLEGDERLQFTYRLR